MEGGYKMRTVCGFGSIKNWIQCVVGLELMLQKRDLCDLVHY